MASIIDLPDFMFNRIDRNKIPKLKKIFLFIKGLIVGLINKHANGKTYTRLINLLFTNANIKFDDGLYRKKIDDIFTIYYPNKRIDRVIIDPKENFDFLFKSYCLDKIDFKKDDIVVDCGANVGELFFSFYYKNYEIQYIAFEPDNNVFFCLNKNLQNTNSKFYNKALSNNNLEKTIYIDTHGANSSLIKFEDGLKEDKVECTTLDSLNLENIKLLKLEAEGFEFEILEGSKKTLSNIKYISVDYGPERGQNSELTIGKVTNFLFENNFEMVDGSKTRYIGLFKNKSF